jgi:hypothetical protein
MRVVEWAGEPSIAAGLKIREVKRSENTNGGEPRGSPPFVAFGDAC